MADLLPLNAKEDPPDQTNSRFISILKQNSLQLFSSTGLFMDWKLQTENYTNSYAVTFLNDLLNFLNMGE